MTAIYMYLITQANVIGLHKLVGTGCHDN